MREIVAKKISDEIKKLCIEANTNLSEDVQKALNKALASEKSPAGKDILKQILGNVRIAWREKLALCQDTGLAFVFLEIGQEVLIVNGDLTEAINEGVRQGYEIGNLRKSAVHPLTRKNSTDNTPAMVNIKIVPGDNIRIRLLTKGGGAENCSAIKMFNPTSTKEDIEAFVLATVEKAGPNACPPVIVGIGIGGSFDHAPLLAKKALLREVSANNSDKEIASWEKDLLAQVNKLGIGPMGLGGKVTALALNIEIEPCHISSLPVAINFDCHAHRYKEITI